jgi:hypothetical protein
MDVIGGFRILKLTNWLILFRQGHLCWCICTLGILIERSVWLVVKYLSKRNSIVSFDEMPN